MCGKLTQDEQGAIEAALMIAVMVNIESMDSMGIFKVYGLVDKVKRL